MSEGDVNGNAKTVRTSPGYACLASKKIIVSCEEMDYDIIKSSPHLTTVPGFRQRRIEEPTVAIMELPGYRNVDYAMMLINAAMCRGVTSSMFDEWIYGLPTVSLIFSIMSGFGQLTQ